MLCCYNVIKYSHMDMFFIEDILDVYHVCIYTYANKEKYTSYWCLPVCACVIVYYIRRQITEIYIYQYMIYVMQDVRYIIYIYIYVCVCVCGDVFAHISRYSSLLQFTKALQMLLRQLTSLQWLPQAYRHRVDGQFLDEWTPMNHHDQW